MLENTQEKKYLSNVLRIIQGDLMEEEISLLELFEILKKRLGMIMALSVLGLILSFVFTFFVTTPQYSATTQMLVSQTESNQTIQQGDINTNLQLINTYKDIIKGPVILDDVRETLEVDLTHSQLSNKIQVASDSASQVFSLEVTDTNPYEAAEIANTTAEIFQNKIDDIMNVDNVTIISAAVPNSNPVSPNKTMNLAIGLLLGLMSGIGLAFVLEFLDNTVKDERFITEELGWTNLGSIMEMSADELALEAHVPQRESRTRTSRTRV